MGDAWKVLHVPAMISRWVCLACRAVFTWHPSHSEPRKRYIREEIKDRSLAYLEDKTNSYRAAASDPENTAVRMEHQLTDDGKREMPTEDDSNPPLMSRSTVWKWLGHFGEMEEAAHRLRARILALDPDSRIHRLVPQIPAKKARSPARAQLLATAWVVLRAGAELICLRGPPAFPR
jgi:hypothetical protein